MQRGQIFYIAKVEASVSPPVYYLNDLKDDPVPGHFYQQQLRLAQDPKTILFEIEDVLKTRTRKGKKESLVKYMFYPEKFSEWKTKKDIQNGPDILDGNKPKRKKRRKKRW